MPEITVVTRKNEDILKSFHDNDWEQIFCAIEKRERDVYVIGKGDDVFGYVTFNYLPKYALFRRLNIPEIQDLYIAPEHRRQGLSHRLMDHCEAHASSNGHAQLGISVSVSPEFSVAQRLYISRGYNVDGNGATYDRQPVDQNTQYPVDGDLCLMMVKELTQEPTTK